MHEYETSKGGELVFPLNIKKPAADPENLVKTIHFGIIYESFLKYLHERTKTIHRAKTKLE